jgi:hypothetical protein
MTTSTLCRECGGRFQVKPSAGRDTYRRRKLGDPTYPFARYCSSRCRKAASRKRARSGCEGIAFCFENQTAAVLFAGHRAINGIQHRCNWAAKVKPTISR